MTANVEQMFSNGKIPDHLDIYSERDQRYVKWYYAAQLVGSTLWHSDFRRAYPLAQCNIRF